MITDPNDLRDDKLEGLPTPNREPGQTDPNAANALNGDANNSQLNDNRHNPANLREKSEAAGEEKTEDELNHIESNQASTLDVAQTELGMGNLEAKKNQEELMESVGGSIAPPIDPPVQSDRGENTDAPL